MHIILTSVGLSSEKVNKYILQQHISNNWKVCIIRNKYCKLAKTQFASLWFTDIFFYDLEKQSDIDELLNANIIYVAWWNTFKLLHFAKKRKFKSFIEKNSENIDIYLWVSAWSVILWEETEFATLLGDINDIWIKDTSWLNIITTSIYPHYTSKDESKVSNYEKQHNIQITRLGNEEFAVYDI